MPEIDLSLDAFESYIASVCTKQTAGRYRMACGFFVEYLRDTGNTEFDKLPPNILMLWVQHLVQERHVAARTVHLYVSGARRYLRWVRQSGVPVPMLHEPDMPRVHHHIRPILPPEYLQRYMDLASELFADPICAAVQFLPSCGLRSSELVSLRLGEISRRKVVLRDGVAHDTFVLQLVGKGGYERIIPVLDDGKVFLTEYLTGWRRHRKGPWLFPMGKRGAKHVATRTIRHALEQMCEPLGRDFSPHTLRRTYAVRLWRRGVDATVIAKVLGHRSVATTYKHYLALQEDDILKSVHGGGA